jgi:hypothetical protein
MLQPELSALLTQNHDTGSEPQRTQISVTKQSFPNISFKNTVVRRDVVIQ